MTPSMVRDALAVIERIHAFNDFVNSITGSVELQTPERGFVLDAAEARVVVEMIRSRMLSRLASLGVRTDEFMEQPTQEKSEG